MQARPIFENDKPDVFTRPSFQFIRHIESIILPARELLGKKAADDMDVARNALEALNRTLNGTEAGQGLKEQLKKYEENRKRFAVDEELYARFDEAGKQVEERKDLLRALPVEYEKAVNKLNEMKNRRGEDLNDRRLEIIGAEAEKIRLENERYNDLAQQKIDLTNQFNKLEAKIQSTCCGNPACSKKEIAQQAVITSQLNEIVQKMPKLPTSTNKTAEESAIATLKLNLEKERAALDAEIKNYPAKKAEAEESLSRAQKRLTKIKREVEKLGEAYYKDLSRITMFDLVHLRAKFDKFKLAVEQVYAAKKKKLEAGVINFFGSKTTLNSQLTNLDQLHGKIDEAEKMVDNLIEVVMCTDSESRTGWTIYTAYLVLSKSQPVIREKFEMMDFSPNELLDLVVPMLKKKESLKIESSLRDLNRFFPNEKKKPHANKESPSSSGSQKMNGSAH